MPTVGGLFYATYGPADGDALILSAGLGGSGGYWAPNIPALAARYRVIAYDHRGTGKSERDSAPPADVDAMADDILALMDGLGIERAHVMGHAAGGVMGLSLALRAPERLGKLIVVNGWSKPDAHFARCFDVRLALLRDSGVEAYVRAQPIFLFPAAWISENSDRLDAEAVGHVAHFQAVSMLEARIAALRAFDIDDRLGEIGIPVLALAAEDDMLVPAPCSHRLAAGMPNATLASMQWGGHACNVTKQDDFDHIVLDWLRS
ncbi:pyrimidine utilization protein D [Sphingoaurantiacus capsulatus]|uniref:Putative carbamate hydrolase RutD n=1 Tax=Sphingoaurantiacus capsulatus TaxID=1771310 RepID=A0ABV7XB29_9SPHN